MIRRALLLTTLSMIVCCASPGALHVETGPAKVPRAEPAYPEMFRVAPSYATFGVSREMRPGEVVRLEVSDLGASRRLRAQRCSGPGCETEAPAGTWDAASISPHGEVELTIEVPGWYYFWIEDFPEAPGQRGAGLLPESVSWEEQTLTLRYGGGLRVVAEPIQAGGSTPSTPPAASGSAAQAGNPTELLRRASRSRAEGDLPAAANLFARADRAAGGGAVEAVAGLCRTEVELGRFEAAIAAARRWIELAGTPAERADAYHHLGLGLVQHALDELYPSAGVIQSPMAPGSPRRHADPILGTDRLRRAAEAFRRAVNENDRDRAVLLDLADTLVWLEEYFEALDVLDDFAAGGGEAALARDLRCFAAWATTRKADEQLFRTDAEVKAPIKVHAPPPQYSEQAREARIMGTMIVAALIDEEGRVVCARPATTLPKGLDDASVEAVKQWRFRPGTLDGEPVATLYNLTLNFTLQ
jgi:TonB family protein